MEKSLLNVFGMQAAKTTLARMLQKTRRFNVEANDLAQRVQEYGYVVVDEFLPQRTFDVVKSEALSLLNDDELSRTVQEHDSMKKSVDILLQPPEFLPGLLGYLQNEDLNHLVQSLERRDLDPLSDHRVIEDLAFLENEHSGKPCDLRADTFFHSHEAWLFLEDVTEHNGALVYVPKSHRYNLCQMKYQYLEGSKTHDGSRMISKKELRESGLNQTVLSAKANSLVIINSAGYHCQTIGEAGAHRRSIHCSYRTNPLSLDAFL